MKKRILATGVISLCLLFALTACGGGESEKSSEVMRADTLGTSIEFSCNGANEESQPVQGYLTIDEGESISAEVALESGAVEIRIYPAGDEEGDAAFDEPDESECIAVMTAYPNGSYPDTDTMSVSMEPGTYLIFFAAAEEDSTGTITVKPGQEK